MASRARKKAASRRPALSTERVLQAALRIADQQGLEALSMRNVARALKVEAMSLYNHVASKEQILDGLVELVVGEMFVPTAGGDWVDTMRMRAHSAHAVLMQHPWATMLLVGRINVGPNMLRYLEATVGCLREAGFSYALADHAWNALDAYVYGFTLQKLNFPLEPSEYAAAARKFLPLIPAEQYPHFHGLAQEVISARHDGLQRLDLGLELLLAGLVRLRKGPSRASPRSRS